MGSGGVKRSLAFLLQCVSRGRPWPRSATLPPPPFHTQTLSFAFTTTSVLSSLAMPARPHDHQSPQCYATPSHSTPVVIDASAAAHVPPPGNSQASQSAFSVLKQALHSECFPGGHPECTLCGLNSPQHVSHRRASRCLSGPATVAATSVRKPMYLPCVISSFCSRKEYSSTLLCSL